jgi:hypothetical protein
MTADATPRVVLIAQWPTIKNAEYELIERIRRTGYKITVVDFLGFDVQNGKCINDATLCDDYDFAISFHYETPKFLNLPTFLWVANPLEFIHSQGNYRTHLIHHLRSYDDYLYNGSDYLKNHVKAIVGADWIESGLAFFQSCSRNALLSPRLPREHSDTSEKLFYCGINWEAISDKEGRAQGLLEILQERQMADFFGPQSVLNVNVWGGFSSYRGEIPFDGASMFPAMHKYGAILALSSPAHLKSKTSSGRVLEGFAAGVPVISDDNHHVRSQFGELVYYFSGSSEQERADSIQAALQRIRTHPEEALERVRQAQALISREYCFETCLERIQTRVESGRRRSATSPSVYLARRQERVLIDVFLFFHDPYAPGGANDEAFPNIPQISRAIEALAKKSGDIQFRVIHCQRRGMANATPNEVNSSVEWIEIGSAETKVADWSRIPLGQKVSRLARLSTGDFAVFFTQSDYPQFDYFTKTLHWFSRGASDGHAAVHVAGFFVSDLSAPAPMSASGILRNSSSNGLYRWTQDSIAEHQLGQLCFNRAALAAINMDRLERFDVLLPVVAILDCVTTTTRVHRSRHLLLRSLHGNYHRYHDAFRRVSAKGLWAQHYELLSNSTHEINGLYDAFHEAPEAVAIADKIYGIDIPPPPPPPPPAPPPPSAFVVVDPAVYQVNNFINTIRPYARVVKRVGRLLGISK